MSASEYVHITVDEVVRMTEKAILIRIGRNETWLPNWAVADIDDYHAGQRKVMVSIKEKIAQEKKLC